METWFKDIIEIRNKCARIGDGIQEKLNLDNQGDPRCGALGMLFNFSTLSMELLSHYHSAWEQRVTAPPHILDRIRNENTQRVQMITKMQFILSVSAIEFCMKETIKNHEKGSLNKWYKKSTSKGKFTNLRAIVNKSKSIDLIENDESATWDCIINLRNCLVHNNAIATITKNYSINGNIIEFNQGVMM